MSRSSAKARQTGFGRGGTDTVRWVRSLGALPRCGHGGSVGHHVLWHPWFAIWGFGSGEQVMSVVRHGSGAGSTGWSCIFGGNTGGAPLRRVNFGWGAGGNIGDTRGGISARWDRSRRLVSGSGVCQLCQDLPSDRECVRLLDFGPVEERAGETTASMRRTRQAPRVATPAAFSNPESTFGGLCTTVRRKSIGVDNCSVASMSTRVTSRSSLRGAARGGVVEFARRGCVSVATPVRVSRGTL